MTTGGAVGAALEVADGVDEVDESDREFDQFAVVAVLSAPLPERALAELVSKGHRLHVGRHEAELGDGRVELHALELALQSPVGTLHMCRDGRLGQCCRRRTDHVEDLEAFALQQHLTGRRPDVVALRNVPLFDGADPISGDLTDQLRLHDAGTKVDQAIGAAPDQASRQAGPNTGVAYESTEIRGLDIELVTSPRPSSPSADHRREGLGVAPVPPPVRQPALAER